jgi:hypothetical protein
LRPWNETRASLGHRLIQAQDLSRISQAAVIMWMFFMFK